MASRPSFSDDSRIIKRPLPKSFLLRDYLLDDMSSCSSNGFRSYPRRQCCATVRFQTDLNKMNWKNNFEPKQSVIRKASAVMIKAFKRLPFLGAGGSSRKASVLPRSLGLSWKVMKHGLWKRNDRRNDEIKMLKSFGDLIKEAENETTRPPPSTSPSRCSTSTSTSTAVTTTGTAELRSSTSNSDSWSGSECTVAAESFTGSGNDHTEVDLVQNDVVDELPENTKTTNGIRVGATTTTVANYSDATENAKEGQEKHEEQFSPVSVMDFPSDDDNDSNDEHQLSSVSRHKHLNIKGTHRSTHNTRRLDNVPQLEPVKLEDRIAQSVIESAQEANQIDKKALALLQLMKSVTSCHHLSKYEAAESLLLAFFKEHMIEEVDSDYEMLQTAKDWVDRQHHQEHEMFIGWESENNWQTYLRDMEKGVNWSTYDSQIEKVNVGLEVEREIFSSLVNDVLVELIMQEYHVEQ